MDPEFTKILIRVAIVGGSIGLVGAGVLFFAVRTYRKGEFRASVLVAASSMEMDSRAARSAIAFSCRAQSSMAPP